jgi:hypothetical protein
MANFDPAAVRVSPKAKDNRYIDIDPASPGAAGISGFVRAADGAALDQRLDALAATVCENDPRTKEQRRADATGPLARLEATLACQCGSEDCPAGAERDGAAAAAAAVIHVLAEQATLDGASESPGYLPGFGILPAESVRELAATATLKPLTIPSETPDPGYRLSAVTREFVAWRDLTCRWPGCDRPVAKSDVDHMVPYPAGVTHASDLKHYCRIQRASRTLNQPCYERIVEVLISDGETHGAYFERSNGGGTPVRRGLQRGRRRGHGRNMRRPDADPRRDVAACVAGTNS